MFTEKFKTEQPFATKFFEAALQEKLAHAYMFTGGDALAQYNLAVQLAKILNCNTKAPDCTCTNCSWISQNRHPAVITVSPIDYLYGNDDGKARTVITIGQAKYLKQSLAIASQYHRIIIFTDAVEGKEHAKNAEIAWKNYRETLSPPRLDSSEDERLDWIPQPLTYKVLHQESANALLKTIEEPSSNVTFFFLTKDKEDMLETIVSRTQVVPVASQNKNIPDISILEPFFNVFPPKNAEQSLAFSERLIEVAKENSCEEEELLIMMQEYMRRLLRANAENKVLSEKIIANIQKIQQAQNQISAYVNKQAVFDSLMLSFTS
jgi:DNA polymerase III delta prime subunit